MTSKRSIGIAFIFIAAGCLFMAPGSDYSLWLWVGAILANLIAVATAAKKTATLNRVRNRVYRAVVILVAGVFAFVARV